MNKQRGFYLWILLVISIALLSYFGRRLQGFVLANISRDTLSIIVVILIVIFTGLVIYALLKSKSSRKVVHLFWFLPLFLIAPFYTPIIEERLHFVFFGVLGIVTMSAFNARLAYILCLLIAGGDELFQHFLPDRVGDWRDVLINSLSVIAGALFYQLCFKSIDNFQQQEIR